MYSSLRLAALLLFTLALLPLAGLRPQAHAAQAAPPTLEQTTPPTELPPFVENEPTKTNNNPASADAIGSATEQRWLQRVQGQLATAGDVDYYSFTLKQPASSVTLSLDGLTADYDLLLASDPDAAQGFDPGKPGLEGVTEIGGQISAIGGQISAIGGQISAIGGQISAIGGQISAISANSGSEPEQIETFLWLPGTYYAVVTANNGQFSDTNYALTVQVDGSGLATPSPPPDVAIRGFQPTFPITTLYIINSDRFNELYPPPYPLPERINPVNTIRSGLNSLAFSPPSPNGAPPQHGYVIDLADLKPINTLDFTDTLTKTYDAWDANLDNPLYANYIAGLIDNVIEAVTTDDATPGVSGPGPAFTMGTGDPLSLFDVKHVVLVGGDNVLPGFRLPDLTSIANEADYATYLKSSDPSGVIDANSPQGAALRYRMITSDNPYGSDRPYKFYGFPFFLPRLSVSRLVESPSEIAAYLKNYLPNGSYSPDFTLDLYSELPNNRSFVSGYDFLKDQATAISQIIAPATAPLPVTTLINDDWTRTELEKAWFNGKLASEFSTTSVNSTTNLADVQLSSVNAHFDHWQLLPAKNPTGTSAGNFPAQRLLSPTYVSDVNNPDIPGGYFRTTLGYSVGCHSGFNVIGSSIVSGTVKAELYKADFAQAINKHGGNWIGNTGYGYGTADGIDYSERLAVLLTQELARDVRVGPSGSDFYIGQSIGEALRNAKQRYVRNATSLSPYDYKALHVMTLYGLPFIRTNVEQPLAPPLEDFRPNGGDLPLQTQAPYTPDNLGRLTRTITFTLDINDPDDTATVGRTGSTIFTLSPDDFTVDDEFVQRGGGRFPSSQVRVFNNNQASAPSLPTFAYDISAESALSDTVRLEVQDVIFMGGTYGQQQNFNPQITQIVTETDTPIVNTAQEPSFAKGAGRWYPDKFFGYSSVGEGEQERDQITAAAAQFRADASGQTGLLRPYTKMVFKVIYDDPGRVTPAAVAVRADDQPPVIESVRIEFAPPAVGGQLAQDLKAVVLVTAYDEGDAPNGGVNSGLDERQGDISGVYVLAGNTWQNVTFTQRGPRLYAATLNVDESAVRIIVRVTDRAGNTSYFTAKGSFQPPVNRNLIFLPGLRR